MPEPQRAHKIDRLFELLRAFQGEGAFNQYEECDPSLERPGGAEIRRRNLRCYLEAFAGASYVLVGEAAGYAGCRFSGIPFTGEAQIVGPEALSWTLGRGLRQSSRDDPWRERSGQIVWEALGDRRDCVLWNAFPWHPHGDELLSNRRPKRAEMVACTEVLAHFVTLYTHAEVWAIGRVSEQKLHQLGIRARYIRHPSHGGKSAFVRGVSALPGGDR